MNSKRRNGCQCRNPVANSLFWLAAAMVGLGVEAPAQPAESPRIAISALVRASESPEAVEVTRTGEVCLVRGEDLRQLGSLTRQMSLEPGDILSSGLCPAVASSNARVESDLEIELTCGEGTVLSFSSAFKVLILEPETRDCAVDLTQGTLDLLTDRPAEVTSGGVTIGVEGTRLTVSRDQGSCSPDRSRRNDRSGQETLTCWLFDGRVSIETGESGEGDSIVLEAGERWSSEGAARGPIARPDLFPGRRARRSPGRYPGSSPRHPARLFGPLPSLCGRRAASAALRESIGHTC